MSIIGYFLKQYGPKDEPSDMFDIENNLYKYFTDEKIGEKSYGKNLELLLIQYHLSTEKNIWDFNYALKAKPVGSYSLKEKAISVIIPVVLKDYCSMSKYERMKKFCDDSVYAVNIIKDRMEKKKLDFKAEKLLQDLEELNEEFLKTYEKLEGKYEEMKQEYIKRKEKKK